MMITNPYMYDRPLRREQFTNRRTEIVWIASRLTATHPQSVSIVGEPGMGKTSLVSWLSHEASRGDYLDDPARYVSLLLSLKDHPVGHPDAFFARVREALETTGYGPMTPSMEGFRSAVKRLMEDRKKVVVFCDDFEEITTNPAFPVEFFAFLRSIANTHDVAYVTTSTAALETYCASPAVEDSPFFNIFTPVPLQPLAEDEARQLVRDRAIVAGAPFATEVEWILRLAGGYPYLLQLAAHVAFAARATGRLTREMLTEQVLREAKAFLQRLWEEQFTEPQREVLRLVGGGKAVQNQHRYAADELVDRGYLQHAGDRYGIHSRLLELFVQEVSGGLWRRLFG